jgi:hypothetical protein
VPRARDAWFFFAKFYEIPRAAVARARCTSSLPIKNTVSKSNMNDSTVDNANGNGCCCCDKFSSVIRVITAMMAAANQ